MDGGIRKHSVQNKRYVCKDSAYELNKLYFSSMEDFHSSEL